MLAMMVVKVVWDAKHDVGYEFFAIILMIVMHK